MRGNIFQKDVVPAGAKFFQPKTRSTMFTIKQIKDAHSKVKTGADYPPYVQELLGLGVTGYSTFLQDGHTVYYGVNNYTAAAPGWGVE